MHTRGSAAVALITAAVALVVPPPPSGVDQPGAENLPGTIGVQVDLNVARDGSMAVTERISVPEGRTATREFTLRQAVGNDLDRIFGVTDPSADRPVGITTTDDSVQLRFGPGETTVRYTVAGAVADLGDRQEVRWQVTGGWDTEVDAVDVTFTSPARPQSVVCLAGPVGSSAPCDIAQIADNLATTAREIGLPAGDRVDIAVGLEPGAVAATARFAETFSLSRAFRLGPVTGVALGVLGLALVAGLAVLLVRRRRDTAALATARPDPRYQPLLTEQRRVIFASPDGVLPGQVGTIVDERVDPIDLTATVLDLVVRNYLWIDEVGDGRWRLVRRNPADAALLDYERAVYEAALGADEHVEVAELRSRLRPALGAITAALVAGVARQGWFARRGALRPIAGGLAAAGVLATIVLAVFTTLALLGVVLVVAGAAIAIGSWFLPARSDRGARLLSQLLTLRAYLQGRPADQVPPGDRELVLSRSLPYAVVLGETDAWLRGFTALDAGTGLYWYGVAGRPLHDLRGLPRRCLALIAALDSATAAAGRLSALAAREPGAGDSAARSTGTRGTGTPESGVSR